MIEKFLLIIYLGLATSAISVALTRAEISNGLRDWLKKENEFLYKLVNCPFCTSFWVAALLVLIYQPETGHAPLFIELVVSILAIVGVAVFPTVVVINGISSLKGKEEEKD